MYIWHTVPIKSLDDLRKTEMLVGAQAPGSTQFDYPMLGKALFDLKFKVVTGYKSTSDINLAMERGEVGGRCGWSWSSVISTRMSWFKEKKVHVLMQLALEKHEDLPNVPLVVDMAKTPEQRAILRLIFARQALGRPFLGPPGIPADRAAALQAAFVAVMKDKALLAEAEKAKLEITPLGGDAVKKIIEESAQTDPAILKRAAAMLKVEKPASKKNK
jgi:hypothetical protein